MIHIDVKLSDDRRKMIFIQDSIQFSSSFPKESPDPSYLVNLIKKLRLLPLKDVLDIIIIYWLTTSVKKKEIRIPGPVL